MDDILNSFMLGPDEQGRFGDFGGRFVSETLMPLILDLEKEYENAKGRDEKETGQNEKEANTENKHQHIETYAVLFSIHRLHTLQQARSDGKSTIVIFCSHQLRFGWFKSKHFDLTV